MKGGKIEKWYFLAKRGAWDARRARARKGETSFELRSRLWTVCANTVFVAAVRGAEQRSKQPPLLSPSWTKSSLAARCPIGQCILGLSSLRTGFVNCPISSRGMIDYEEIT